MILRQLELAAESGGAQGSLNGASSVELVAEPAAGFVRCVDSVRILNIDTAVVTITVRKTIAGPTHYAFDQATALVVNTAWNPVDASKVIRLAVDESITALMAGAAATTNPTWVASWIDVPVPV